MNKEPVTVGMGARLKKSNRNHSGPSSLHSEVRGGGHLNLEEEEEGEESVLPNAVSAGSALALMEA